MDHTYLYVGASGGTEQIKRTANIPAEKLTYVMCDCSYGEKKNLIQNAGNSDSEIIMSNCGGREKLEEILEDLLE